MSTTQTPVSTVVETFSDALTEVLQGASEAARVSARMYLDGLDAVVEQQKLARASSREWMTEIVHVQSDLGRELIRGYATVARRSAETAAEAADQAKRSAEEAPHRPRTQRAPVSPKRAAARPGAPKRTATPPAAEVVATAASAVVPAWSNEGYDSLNAAEVVEKLPGYSQRELGEVEVYERAHEARQTVLARVESLRGVEPVPGYDELTVPEVQSQLTDADEALARSVRDYEQRHKKREGVLSAARTRIEKTAE